MKKTSLTIISNIEISMNNGIHNMRCKRLKQNNKKRMNYVVLLENFR